MDVDARWDSCLRCARLRQCSCSCSEDETALSPTGRAQKKVPTAGVPVSSSLQEAISLERQEEWTSQMRR